MIRIFRLLHPFLSQLLPIRIAKSVLAAVQVKAQSIRLCSAKSDDFELLCSFRKKTQMDIEILADSDAQAMPPVYWKVYVADVSICHPTRKGLAYILQA